ncbi:hypothetical protein GSI_01048 [Ganoderma sinense ZZ0214-1]|uniref:DNA mismatch repair protein S5 domain-containing protein n=1 Tax=Ganoderma sinense ZZ0214-1 TaxID=1077348 RepID=A0A2G8SUA7_9APHY|nr:hypothetical protein GSI_01048 [Ganoderma sinense ZZ0214-1]
MNVAGPSQSTPIKPLSSSTKSRLRSTQILTSLPQVVSELIQNSLDSGARNIEVSIDPGDWECWVRDDGSGISRDGLALLARGPETGRYGTSKAYDTMSLDEVNTFGFRGEALASIANLCCLEISSRTTHSAQSWSVIMKGEQTLYSGPSIRWRRESPGTVVSVRDAFYNLPIRRKAHPNPPRIIELVRRDISAYALVFPGVSFTLDTMQRAKDSAQNKPNARLLTVSKTSSTLFAFRHLYGKALATHVEEVSERHDQMSLEGFLSLHGVYSKAYQFLYINRHPLETCGLHRTVEGVFARSSFSKHAYDEEGTMDTIHPSRRRSPRKTEKKPVYVLNLTISPRFVDNTVEPAKTAVQLQNSAAAAAFLSSVVEAVLVRHGFLSRRSQKADRHDGTPPPRKIRKSTHAGGPDPSGLLAGLSLNRSSSQGQGGLVPTDTSGPGQCGSAPPGRTTFLLPAIQEEEALIVGEAEEATDILWKDPATGETFVVDARTGNSYPQNAPAGSSTQDASGTPVPRLRRSLGERDSARTGTVPAWMAEALQANEAYRIVEQKIPVLPSSADFVQRFASHSCNQGSGAHRHAGPQQQTFHPWDAPNFGRFSKDDLRQALVLGQVDRKFIACVMHPTVDDEGIRSEPMNEYRSNESQQNNIGSGVCTRKLDPPVNILLTRPEAERIGGSSDVRGAFSRWGVSFALPSGPIRALDGGADYASYIQVAVNTVPEVVAEKLLAGDELRTLVKGFLARLESNGVPDVLCPHGDGSDVLTWQKALRWCPQELVELVNSKACRGAIMFNDTLTLEQCKALVAKLSDTDMPFQCAHGRPSLVPLVNTRGATKNFGASHAHVNWSGFIPSQIPPGWESTRYMRILSSSISRILHLDFLLHVLIPPPMAHADHLAPLPHPGSRIDAAKPTQCVLYVRIWFQLLVGICAYRNMTRSASAYVAGAWVAGVSR